MEKVKRGKRFSGSVKKGEIRNPYGRSGKPSLNYRKAKEGLLQVFVKSEAAGTIFDMLNMKLPSVLRPEGRVMLSVEEDMRLRILLLTNFKWAVEQFLKILPKEIGVFGKIGHIHTLSGMVKSAEIETKSPKVLEMTKVTEMEEDILGYQTTPDSVDEYESQDI